MNPGPAPETNAPGVRGQSLTRHRRPSWFAIALAAGLLAIVFAGGAAAWNWYRLPARLAAALPALPDLNDQPEELQERMRNARAEALDRATALDGVAELGRLCQANGFPAEAEACWQLLLSEQPGNAHWHYYLADLRRGASDYAGMAGLLARTTELAPTYAPAWLHLANLQFKSGQLADAQRAYQKRLALLPGDPYARLGLARVALQQDQRDEAREQIKQLVQDAPAFPPGHNLYAEMLAAEGDTAGASKERLLGRDTGRFREAADPWLDELITRCFDYDRLCVRGAVDALTSHGDRGKSLYERAIRLRPDALHAYELLGDLYVELGDITRAREIYEQGQQHATATKPSARFYANLSRVYGRLQQPAEAVRVAREGLAQVGEDAELYDALGTALGDLGERAAAVDALRTAVARHPGDAGANYHLAVALLAVHRLDEAIEALHRSLAAQPTFPTTLALLAQIEIDSGRWQNAAQYLQRLYESNPEMPEAREKMADCHLHAGAEAEKNRDVAAAEQHYRAGLAINRDHAELQARLGALYLIQRRFTDAVTPLETYHRLAPDNAQSALFLGQAYAAVGRRDEARRILTHGAQLAEHGGNATTARHCREILQRLP